MKRTLAVPLLALTIAFAPGVAVAKGCITGAIAGGVAGHWSWRRSDLARLLNFRSFAWSSKLRPQRQLVARRA
jgi:hypothetical protein